MIISNLKVYDLEESLLASGYAMRTELNEIVVTDKTIKRAMNLTKASNGNGAHGQFLTGIRVNFDLTLSLKAWVEAERYRFLEFVTSQSTMHRITKFDIKQQCNKYVDERIINIVEEKVRDYNVILDAIKTESYKEHGYTLEFMQELAKEQYLEVLYNIPSGFQLTARMTTNYRCLLNIYVQRHDHRLPEWREFCELLLELPYFKELVDAYYSKENNEKKGEEQCEASKEQKSTEPKLKKKLKSLLNKLKKKVNPKAST